MGVGFIYSGRGSVGCSDWCSSPFSRRCTPFEQMMIQRSKRGRQEMRGGEERRGEDMECSRSAVQCRGMEGMNGWMVARGANELMRWRAHSMLLCAVCGCACRFQRANPNPPKKKPTPQTNIPDDSRGPRRCLPTPPSHASALHWPVRGGGTRVNGGGGGEDGRGANEQQSLRYDENEAQAQAHAKQ